MSVDGGKGGWGFQEGGEDAKLSFGRLGKLDLK